MMVPGIGSGTLKDKRSVVKYWPDSTQKMPDLDFSLIEIT
jgi:hypothetical protein